MQEKHKNLIEIFKIRERELVESKTQAIKDVQEKITSQIQNLMVEIQSKSEIIQKLENQN